MEKNKIYAFLAIDQFKKILMYPEFQHTSIYPIEDLKTLTTSSRMSAWMLCALPLGIAVMVNFMNPDYMDPLWHDPRGQKMVYAAAGMQLIGMLIIRSIMRIKI